MRGLGTIPDLPPIVMISDSVWEHKQIESLEVKHYQSEGGDEVDVPPPPKIVGQTPDI